jgi:hypothetical protein
MKTLLKASLILGLFMLGTLPRPITVSLLPLPFPHCMPHCERPGSNPGPYLR